MRACRLAQFSRAAWYRKSTASDQAALRLRIRDLAHARPRFGYLRIWVLLRREGWLINRKRVRRLYRLDGLQLRMRVRRRKHIALHRGPAPIPVGPTERWSMCNLPGQGDTANGELLASSWARYSVGGSPASASWGRSSL